MRQGPAATLASSPTMIGAMTVLITIVAVFLAYNANTGLPFVATYDLTAHVPDANALVKGNEVRIGGVRVGRVASVTAEQREDGGAVANLELELDQELEPLPADSTMIVRPRGPLALNYLEITPGDSPEGLSPGDTIPARRARPNPVAFDDVFNTFDDRTRRGVRGNLRGFGDALTGRGPDLNDALGALRPLVESALPAASNLADRHTRLGDFWDALAATAAEVAPVALTQAELFVVLDRTFAAFAEVARPYIEKTISRSPATLGEGIRSLPAMRPFLRHSKTLFTALEPGAEAAAETSPEVAGAIRVGTPVLRASPKLNRQLEPTAQALVDFQEADGVRRGLGQLIDLNEVLDPTLRFIVPAQAHCNYLSVLFDNVADLGSVGDGLGTWTRFIAFAPPNQQGAFTPPSGPNNEGMPSAASADGPESFNHLHSNPYPLTGATGQDGACDAGREGYRVGQTVIGNPRGGG